MAINLVKEGTGTLTLNGTNGYTGATTIRAGKLEIGNGGTTGLLGVGAVNLAAGELVFNRSDSHTVENLITGSGILRQWGSGTTVLTGSNGAGDNFRGNVFVDRGTLAINGHFGDVNTSMALLTVGANGTLSGSGVFYGIVNMRAGTLAPGNSPGTLTIAGHMVIGSDALLNFELGRAGTVGGPSNDLVRVSGNLTLNGKLNIISASPTYGPGYYRLFNYGAYLTNNGLTFGTIAGGLTPTLLTNISGQVNLLLSDGSGQVIQYWDGTDLSGTYTDFGGGGGSGEWNSTSTNWTMPSGYAVNDSWKGQIAVFGGAAGGEVTLTGTQNFQELQFHTDGYELTGTGSLVTTGGFSVVDVESGISTTISAGISGLADLVKRGGGTLVLSGANSYGNTVIEGGKLVGNTASLSGNVDLDGATTALDFNTTGTETYGGVLSGTGQVSHSGGGILRLTGDSSAFAGSSKLNSGTLLLDGKLGGSLDVLSGAALGGTGTLGAGAGSIVTIASGGSLSPGNSIGTLNIDGNLTFASGSRFEVEVDPFGTAGDLVSVSGAVSLNGGTVAHIGATGHYKPRSTYTILSAGTLTGEFGSVTSDFAFLDPKHRYDYAAGTVQMQLLRNDIDFASMAVTRNQFATANAIDSIGIEAANAVYDAIVQLADHKALILNNFDQLSGDLHASTRTALIEDSRFVRDTANDRLRLASRDNAQDPTFWAQSFGSWGTFDTDAGTNELDRQIGGAMMGGDAALKTWRVGAMAGFSQSEVKGDRQKSTADNTYLGLYAGTSVGSFGLRAGIAQSWHDIDATRSVQMPGLSDHLRADYSATTRQGFVEADYSLIAREDARLETFANLAHVTAKTDEVSEEGDAAALHIRDSDTQVTFSTLGLRGSRDINLGQSRGTLRGSAGWRHASGDETSQNLQTLSEGDDFTVWGGSIAKDSAVIEAGLDVVFSVRTTFGLVYSAQLSDTAKDHGFTARLNIRF